MTPAEDRRFMALALALGRRGLGRTWPNPAVGCVIVREGRVIGRGWTGDGGRPHAETVALAQAGAAARGATAYVSLEPCAHHGQTPPCAEALVAAGISRAVVAMRDPDPRVNGGGLAKLKAAGIEVTEGVLAEEAREDQAGFLSRVSRGRPMVTLKLAASLDGRIATAGGESRWITGPLARRVVHAARARNDAVMIGAGTARADNPSLTVRELGATRQPVRIVLSRRLDLPTEGGLGRDIDIAPLWLCHGPEAPRARLERWTALGATCIACPIADGRIDTAAALAALAERGLTRVFCEGGGALGAALLASDLVDRLLVFAAGTVLGAEGVPALGAMGVGKLAEAPRFDLVGIRSVGGDVMQSWRRRSDSDGR